MGKPRLISTSVSIYRALLWLYPPAYRDDYGHWMAQAFRDQCRDAARQSNLAWIALWCRTLYDVALTAVVEHLASRKVRIMQSTLFKNQPDRLGSILFLIPGLLLSIYYVLTIYSGEITGYMGLAGIGAVGFLLGYVKILRRARIWEQFTLGFAIGVAGFLVTMMVSPLWNLGIPALRTEPWPSLRALLALGICLAAIGLFGRWIDRSRRLFWAVSVVLLVNGLVWALLPVGLNLNTNELWDISWTWGQAAAILGVVAFSFRSSRRGGILTLLTVIVSLGTLNAVNMMTADVAEGKTPFGQIILLLGYLFPLVVCPAWLLLAPTWRMKKYGVLLSWGVLWACTVWIVPAADAFLTPHFFFRLDTLDIISRITTHTPLFIGLWLAFTLYERQYRQPELDTALGETTIPLTPTRAES